MFYTKPAMRINAHLFPVKAFTAIEVVASNRAADDPILTVTGRGVSKFPAGTLFFVRSTTTGTATPKVIPNPPIYPVEDAVPYIEETVGSGTFFRSGLMSMWVKCYVASLTVSYVSNEVSMTTPAGNKPTAPAGYSPVDSPLHNQLFDGPRLQISGATVIVTLRDNAINETNFQIERSEDGGATWPVMYERGSRAGTGTTTYTDVAVVSGRTYTYRVRAKRLNSSVDYFSQYSRSASITYLNYTPLVAAAVWMAAGALTGKFETTTELSATVNFGAWVTQPLGSLLLIGAGNSPGNEDGALMISSADGTALTSEEVIDSQGVHDLHVQGDELWAAGTDPTGDWSLGEVYHRDDLAVWAKLRTLPNTIHCLGLWHDGTTLFAVGGMHTGDSVTFIGLLLKSTDGGATWTAIDLNHYRVYDVIGFDSNLYAVGHDWTGSVYTQDLHVSADAGDTWAKVSGVTPAFKPRLVLHAGALFGVRSNHTGLFKIAAGGAVTLYSTPVTLADHWQVLDSDGTYLYALDVDGQIWRTADFVEWVDYTEVPGAISIRWWAGHGLIVGDMGTAAQLWLA